MANPVVMPRLGWTMEVGRVVEWLKQEGEAVEAGEFLFSVETDKAVTEVEALDSGILHIPPEAPAIGEDVAVGAMLAWLVPAGEPLPLGTAGRRDGGTAGNEERRGGEEARGREVGVRTEAGRVAVSPRARRAAASLGVDWTVLVGSGSSGRIRERDVLLAAQRTPSREAATSVESSSLPAVPPSRRPAAPAQRASPAVRQLAEANGVDLYRVPAGGPAGRVTRADVRAAAHTVRDEGRGTRDETSETAGEVMPFGPIRRITAERMAESAHTIAPVTLTTEADATDLVAIRSRLKEELAASGEPVPSITDLLVRLAALALREHPDLNASFGDGGIVRHAAVHVGVAVDTERGLLAPVVRDADRKSIHQIAAESARLIEQARNGTAALDDLTGSTFTISNLGMFEIDAFTPIVNLPECAVLGLGRVVARPVVVDEAAETIAVRKMLALSLTFDHRVVDGAPAARFLQRLKGMVERPYVWLTR